MNRVPLSLGERTKRVDVAWMRDQDGRLGVVDLVPNLALGLREGQRHRHTTRPPDAPLHGDVLEASGHEKHHASATEVIRAPKQGRRHPLRRRKQVAVAERPLRRDGRPSRRKGLGSLDDGNGHGEGALYQTGHWIRIDGWGFVVEVAVVRSVANGTDCVE